MQLSLWPGLTQPWDDVVALARHADVTGWHGVWVADHFMVDAAAPFPADTPTLEATAALAALATATERVRLGPLVLGATYRHPAVLASWAATVDHASGGRLVLGVGAGWQQNEHEQYGIALPAPRERVDRFAEYVEVLHALLRSAPGAQTSFDGTWFQLRDARSDPKPLQRPVPLLVGGKGTRMLGIVARHADEWNMWSTPDQLRERRAVLDRRCEEAGRDPAEIRTSTQALLMVSDDERAVEAVRRAVGERPIVAGTIGQVVQQLSAYRDAGVDELIVPDSLLGRTTSERRQTMDLLLLETAPLR